jgi:hypothetical protein
MPTYTRETLDFWRFRNVDDASNPIYVGSDNKDTGGWRIMRFNTDTGVASYAYGHGDYAAAWSDRAAKF